jgi:hypothetical protein
MDFHWDTPGRWARLEVGNLLQDFGARDVARFADEFELTSANYDGEPEMGPDLLVELSRWAAAGVQYWPGRQPIDEAPVAWGPHGPLAIGTIERASLEEDGIPW